MHTALSAVHTRDGLTVKGYRGDRSALLAFDLAESLTAGLAGFAIRVKPPKGAAYWLPNRLSFATAYTSKTTAKDRVWTDSVAAPFQKFHWVHFPADVPAGVFTYEVTAMYHDGNTLKKGPTVATQLDLQADGFANLEYGFTRGYMSSQAYATRFKNADVRPGKTLDFDIKPYEERWAWLGGHGREIIKTFVAECLAAAQSSANVSVDVFAYDFDAPDLLADLAKLKNKLRVFIDDSDSHTKPGALEPVAGRRLADAGAAVRYGHFRRYAHQKVMILRRNGVPVAAISGSANFSVRGLYVQANNVLRWNDATVAGWFGQAFDLAFASGVEKPGDKFSGTEPFKKSALAKAWLDVPPLDLPNAKLSFAPHTDGKISMDLVSRELAAADSSVLFAVMELGGSGATLKRLREVAADPGIYSYGITQKTGGDISLYKPGSNRGVLVPFAALSQQVPANFRKETAGGQGQVIHHKFIVVDFNDTNPVVFAGSSNLAELAEQENNDNLFALYDRNVATAYAIEALRLVDHNHFRAALNKATAAQPLQLQGPKPAGKAAPWWQRYYNRDDLRCRERTLFVR